VLATEGTSGASTTASITGSSANVDKDDDEGESYINPEHLLTQAAPAANDDADPSAVGGGKVGRLNADMKAMADGVQKESRQVQVDLRSLIMKMKGANDQSQPSESAQPAGNNSSNGSSGSSSISSATGKDSPKKQFGLSGVRSSGPTAVRNIGSLSASWSTKSTHATGKVIDLTVPSSQVLDLKVPDTDGEIKVKVEAVTASSNSSNNVRIKKIQDIAVDGMKSSQPQQTDHDFKQLLKELRKIIGEDSFPSFVSLVKGAKARGLGDTAQVTPPHTLIKELYLHRFY
jgi:hypothetical protein